MTPAEKNASIIKSTAKRLGFPVNHFDKRLDPIKDVEGSKIVVTNVKVHFHN